MNKLPNQIFDKVYVISFVKNTNKQKQIQKFFKKLKMKFEFIYGIDSVQLQHIFNINNIHFMNDNANDYNYNLSHISCNIAHYTAIQHALANNYNKILIIEDDAIFTEDIEYINYCFNNMPDNADICRFGITFRFNDIEDNNKSLWYLNESTVGNQCYSLNNKEIMSHIINEMNNHFTEIDSYKLYNFHNVYVLKDVICTDPYSNIIIHNK